MSTQTSLKDQEVVDELPITSSPSDASVVKASANKLTLVPLIFLIYFEVAGGPYGQEPTVKAAGPLLAILGFAIFPFIWCVPEALITAELATAFPGNGGFVLWAKYAFGTFPGAMMGYLKFLGAVINIATFPVLSIEYMDKLFPMFESGWPRVLAIAISMCILSFLNFTGLKIVGYGSIIVGIVILMPFALMSLIAIPKIEPHRWGSPGQKGMQIDWNLYLNTLFWNLNYWDSVSTLAGEVDKPQKTFPAALLFAGIFTWVSYLIPLLAVTGALPFHQNQWGSGFHAVAAEIIAGKWLKIWLEAGAVLASIGMFEAQLSSTSYQLLGMADLGLLPKFFSVRHSKFGTPWVGILVSSSIALVMSFIDFKDMISSANFLYSLGMLMEFASFIWLRKKLPSLNRPFRVPLEIPGLMIMCLLPSCVLLVMMRYATWLVCLISGLIIAGAIGSFFLMEILKSNKIFKFSTTDEGFSRLNFCD